jgi:hypothetical protein
MMQMEVITMQSVKKIVFLLVSLALIFLLPGCSSEREPADVVVRPDSIDTPQNDAVGKRFRESTRQTPTAVKSAVELSEKYARLSEEAAVLRQQHQESVARNKQLEDQVVALETELQQTQTELGQANSLLIEMRIELNKWKTDILGFRDEMRDAETAQLETLLRILKVLGGQVDPESARAGNTGDVGSAVASMHRPDRP